MIELSFADHTLMAIRKILHSILVTLAFGRELPEHLVEATRCGRIGTAGSELDSLSDFKSVLLHHSLSRKAGVISV